MLIDLCCHQTSVPMALFDCQNVSLWQPPESLPPQVQKLLEAETVSLPSEDPALSDSGLFIKKLTAFINLFISKAPTFFSRMK